MSLNLKEKYQQMKINIINLKMCKSIDRIMRSHETIEQKECEIVEELINNDFFKPSIMNIVGNEPFGKDIRKEVKKFILLYSQRLEQEKIVIEEYTKQVKIEDGDFQR